MIKLVLLAGLVCWVAIVVRKLWFCYRFQPKRVLVLVLQNQEELVEKVVYHLLVNWGKIELGRWEVVFLDLGSQDQTGAILRRICSHRFNLELMRAAEAEKQAVVQEIVHRYRHRPPVVLALLDPAAGNGDVCGQLDRILAS